MNYRFESVDKESKEFLKNIQSHFNGADSYIHKARNELKIILYNQKKYVVKSFKVPGFLKSAIYTFFRDSKAKKSFINSLKIGSFAPKPVGYIEFYKNGLLNKSYFVSEYFDYDFTIREPLLDKNFKNREEVFRAFARFTLKLHNSNIFHNDYSPGNILIKEEKGEYIFKIVDINRMKFIHLTKELRMKNFSKLWIGDEDLKIVIKEYAKVYQQNESDLLNLALKYSHALKRRINFKKRLKGIKIVD